MDDLLAISMDPRVGMVQGDQPLEKRKCIWCKTVKTEIILIRSVDKDFGFFNQFL